MASSDSTGIPTTPFGLPVLPANQSAEPTPQPRRTSFQRLTARFTMRPKQPTPPPPTPTTTTTTLPEHSIPDTAAAPATVSLEDQMRAETLARLKRELVFLNEKERSRQVEASADRARVREAVELFRKLAAEGGRESVTGIGSIGELVE